ncbi:RNA-directed DNA polymerase, eukaryota, Nucleotide-binding alpha-beta plait domain protein [Artemisia annua]|uniref:RNA-directed DNA polymerase, eukaryota, Nucleotide-binding alpha-beta plait domain protein n=1 Tax=Artemisia annua TaxID=35608 RepID=A0A2U1QMV5_ARTAN|nr:RNA-directed DNA polymerase, eukaryota, Nucleotide-binding alpha-beta plait domain protein [Artemisia annua]
MGRYSNKTDSNGWTWVFNKNKESNAKPIGNPFNKDVEKVASSFYVSNFPDSLDARGLWNLCAPYGRLVDAFIAFKRSKGGKRFGFIRYVGVKDNLDFVRSLSNIWIGSFHLYVTVARFQRSKPTEPKQSIPRAAHTVPFGVDNHNPNNTTHTNTAMPTGIPSFASIVHGDHKRCGGTLPSTKPRSICLKDQDLISIDDASKVLLVKLKEVESMNNMYKICRNEGFVDLKIHHAGGLWIWIQFPSVASCSEFQSNASINRLSSSIKYVTPSFKVDERMIWIEINGLPLCAWGSNAFKKVACMFGKFMFFETEQSAAMCTGRVCISTKSQQFVSESVQVEIHGETFNIQVHELGTWNIDIIDESLDSLPSDDENEVEKVEDSVDDNLVDGLDELINDLSVEKEEKEEHGVNKPNDNIFSNMAKTCEEHPNDANRVKESYSQPSNEENTSDLSCPPGFEHLKKGSSRKCSTSFARYRRKDTKGISLIHELTRLIEVGGSLGLDVRGCRKSLNKMINGVQESKMTRLELYRLKSMWGNYSFDYACSLARGRSGGLISMWDPNTFVKEDIWCDDAFIIVKGRWKNKVGECYMINLYGPHDPMAKVALWNRVWHFMQSHRGKYMLFGDMNEVRNEQERHGSIFSRNEADIFNSFINTADLIDLPMGGHTFTWMNKLGTKLSKLDRFLISEDVLNSLPDICVTALDRLWSDHNPILLHCNKVDFGPVPFKLYHSWFSRDGFDNTIKTELGNLVHDPDGRKLLFHEKLKRLKLKVKQWHTLTKCNEGIRKQEIVNELKKLEENIEAGTASSDNLIEII